MMKINYVFLKPVTVNAKIISEGRTPLITGLVHVDYGRFPTKLCYEVKYEDDVIAYIPKSDVDNGDYMFTIQ
jgi:hypothetical protein